MLEPLIEQAMVQNGKFSLVMPASAEFPPMSDSIYPTGTPAAGFLRRDKSRAAHPAGELMDVTPRKRLLAAKTIRSQIETATSEDAYAVFTAATGYCNVLLGELAEFCVPCDSR